MSQPVEGEIVNNATGVELTKHDEIIVRKLETAFNNGFNITEACQYAGISRETYYNWLDDDNVFSYRMSVAQTALNRKAKQNVMEAINNGDPSISLRFLTLRDPDFKPKGSLEIDPGDARVESKLKEFMDDTDDDAYPVTADAGGAEPTTDTEPESGTEVAPSTPAIQD